MTIVISPGDILDLLITPSNLNRKDSRIKIPVVFFFIMVKVMTVILLLMRLLMLKRLKTLIRYLKLKKSTYFVET